MHSVRRGDEAQTWRPEQFGALHTLLRHRGETIVTFAVAVPVAVRWATTGMAFGNQVSPLLVTVRGTGPFPILTAYRTSTS